MCIVQCLLSLINTLYSERLVEAILPNKKSLSVKERDFEYGKFYFELSYQLGKIEFNNKQYRYNNHYRTYFFITTS